MRPLRLTTPRFTVPARPRTVAVASTRRDAGADPLSLAAAAAAAAADALAGRVADALADAGVCDAEMRAGLRSFKDDVAARVAAGPGESRAPAPAAPAAAEPASSSRAPPATGRTPTIAGPGDLNASLAELEGATRDARAAVARLRAKRGGGGESK